MSAAYDVVRETVVEPTGLTARRIQLSPLELYSEVPAAFISWPLFFAYGVGGDRLLEALHKLAAKWPILFGRLRPDAATRVALEVDPGGGDSYGLAFSEVRADMTLAEAFVKHGRISHPSASYSVYPDLPFYMEGIDGKALLKGEAPTVRVRLTHFSDGCAVNIAIAHCLVDGERYFVLFEDLGRAYRGADIPERSHDRSALWPDQLAKFYPSLGEETARLPRVVNSRPPDVKHASFPDESFAMEMIYFSKEVLDGMKALIKPFLAEEEFVSTNDMLVSLSWLLKAELRVDPETAGEADPLGIKNTLAISTAELRQNGVNIFPENFAGNAYAALVHSNQGREVEGKGLVELFAEYARMSRTSLNSFRQAPEVQAQVLMMSYGAAATGDLPVDVSTIPLVQTNLAKTPIRKADFGGGPAVLVYIPSAFPVNGSLVGCGPFPATGPGVAICTPVLSSQIDKLKDSRVLTSCAPGAKFVFSQMTPQECEALWKE